MIELFNSLEFMNQFGFFAIGWACVCAGILIGMGMKT